MEVATDDPSASRCMDETLAMNNVEDGGVQM